MCGGEIYSECQRGNNSSDGKSDAIIDDPDTCVGDNCNYCQRHTTICGVFGVFSVAVVAMTTGLLARLKIRAMRVKDTSGASSRVEGTFTSRNEGHHYEDAAVIRGTSRGIPGISQRVSAIRSKDFGSKEIALNSEEFEYSDAGTPTFPGTPCVT